MSGLTLILGAYGLQLFGSIVLILLGVLVFDKRFNSHQGTEVPSGFIATEEVNIDPVSHIKTTVYYNEFTGERFYKKEK